MHFERALDESEAQPANADTAALLFALARAELGARELFDLGGVLDHMYRAFDYFADAGDTAQAVEVAAHPLPPIYSPTELPERIERALALAVDDSIDEGRLLANAAWYIGTHEGDQERARMSFDRALAIARRLGDASLERRTLASAAQVEYWFINLQECWDSAVQARDLAEAAGDRQTEITAREFLARVALMRGQPEQAQTNMDRAIELGELLGERSFLATTHIMGGGIAMFLGDWKAARTFSDQGLALQPREPRNLAIRRASRSHDGRVRRGQDVHGPADRPSATKRLGAMGSRRRREFHPSDRATDR